MIEERKRLNEKLCTGLVSSIWLQFGTDIKRLKKEIPLLRKSYPKTPIIGSIFIPSKKFLAQFRFRPWRGVHCSPEYLNDLDTANKITNKILCTYRDLKINPLVETSIAKDADAIALKKLLAGVFVEHDLSSTLIGSTAAGVAASTLASTPNTTIPACNAIQASEKQVGIVLFRITDLRLHDHQPLHLASEECDAVVPIFLWSNGFEEAEAMGYSQRARAA